MVFTIFAERGYRELVEYTVTINASYSELEEASKCENFIAWVVANATQIESHFIGDFTSNDFSEIVCDNADGKLAIYYVVYGDDADLLPPCPSDDDDEY